MTDRPNRYAIRSSDDRRLAAVLMGLDSVRGVHLDPRRGVQVEVTGFGSFAMALPRLAQQEQISLLEVAPTDESLESVFTYLVSA